MPRIPPRLIRQASAIDPLLQPLLIATRDLASARNELRWLKEHAIQQCRSVPATSGKGPHDWRQLLRKRCLQRSKGKPLQYILGTEFFGDLEIRCKPGVLIPRWETASTTTHLATLLNSPQAPRPSRLKILDLCTGTGCITLLISHLLSRHRPVNVLGLDISPTAIGLAKENLALYPAGPGSKVDFRVADVLASPACPSAAAVSDTARNAAESDGVSSRDDAPPGWRAVLRDYEAESAEDYEAEGGTAADRDRSRTGNDSWHVLVSNPPYVSPVQYRRTTTRSVRHFEPRVALVPPSSSGQYGLDGTSTSRTGPREGKAGLSDAARGAGRRAQWEKAGDEKAAGRAQDEKSQDDRIADAFYPALLNVAIETGVKVLLVEIGDAAQASRVVGMVRQTLGEKWRDLRVEVWRDEPSVHQDEDVDGSGGEGEELQGMVVRGRGNVRAVFAWDAREHLL